VTNISSQFFTSDIPDWGCAVTGIQAFESIMALPSGKPADNSKRLACLSLMWEMSPMSSDLSQVKTPVLFGLGAKDRRVPSTEGLQFRDSLSNFGVVTKTLWYPEDCHPLDSVKTYSDFAVNWAIWIKKYSS